MRHPCAAAPPILAPAFAPVFTQVLAPVIALIIGALGCIVPLPAAATQLVIARAASPSGMDPAFLREPATLVDNVFDTLVGRDAKLKLVPDLALSWTAAGPADLGV